MNEMRKMFDFASVEQSTGGTTIAAGASPELAPKNAIEVRNLNFFYGSYQGLKNINLDIEEGKVTAFIGPSGCGKTTLTYLIGGIEKTVNWIKKEKPEWLPNAEKTTVESKQH